MISSDKHMVQTLVKKCLEFGITKVVVSPGSRNAPIVIAMDEHPQIECTLIHDERVAGFVAMGMAQQIKQPVALVCTSGSALLNYYPAVAEAYYQRIPLVVISADRPQKWVNQGHGQTIVQDKVYANHIEAQTTIEEEDELILLEEKLEHVLCHLQNPSQGPLHINVALNEPLYNRVELEDEEVVANLFTEERTELTGGEKQIIKEGLALPKKLILIGQMTKKEYLQASLNELAGDPSIAILVENTSNLVSKKWIHCIDRSLAMISEEQLAQFAPDLLITMGGAVISKRIKAYLQENKPTQHWKVGYDFPEMNTYESLTHSFQVEEAYFINQLRSLKPDLPTSNFGAKWKQIDFLAADQGMQFIEQTQFSDLRLMELVLDYIPEGSHLHLGNSSIVRYAQLFEPVDKITYWSNRGTSGIDGSTSTAIGAALANPKQLHVLITGDVSFFYDSNALWNNYQIPNLRIIVVNNGGGGIFNIIDGPKSTAQNDSFFVAKHGFSAEKLCEAFGVGYTAKNNLDDFATLMQDFYAYKEDGHISLIEFDTSRVENHEVLKAYFNSLKN